MDSKCQKCRYDISDTSLKHTNLCVDTKFGEPEGLLLGGTRDYPLSWATEPQGSISTPDLKNLQ